VSQPCSLLELLLVDARDLGVSEAREMLALAVSRSIPHGALSLGRENTALLTGDDLLDFWLVSESEEWPFERAAAFTGVEQARTLFVSTHPLARQQAMSVGVTASAPDVDFMERLLP